VLVLLLAWRGLSGLGDPFAGSSPASSGGSRSTSSPTSSSPATAAASASSTPTGASTPVQVQQAAGFDPRGDGSENDQEAGRATDGDAGTSWTSETYRSADFGGLKPGVGLRLDLGGQHDVHRVQVEVGGSGSTVQLRRAHGDTLSSKVLDQRRNASGTVSLVPSTALRTDELVVWFTRAARSGGGYRVEVAEVTVS
jgi:hypothetical protein